MVSEYSSDKHCEQPRAPRFRGKHEARTICPSVQDFGSSKRACRFWQQKEESAIRKHAAAIRHNAIPGRQVCFRMSGPNYALQRSPVISYRNLTFVLSVEYSQVTVQNSAALSTGRRRRGSRCVPRNRGALHRATRSRAPTSRFSMRKDEGRSSVKGLRVPR